jgi:hypothetical protein
VSGADRRARGLRGELYAGVGVALNCHACAHALVSSPSLTSWRDVPAAEAWPPSFELGQTAPRMIVPVVSPRGLLLVPSRSFASGLLLACPFEILHVRLVACPFEILRVQRCGHDLARVFPLALVAVVRSSGLLSRVRRVA